MALQIHSALALLRSERIQRRLVDCLHEAQVQVQSRVEGLAGVEGLAEVAVVSLHVPVDLAHGRVGVLEIRLFDAVVHHGRLPSLPEVLIRRRMRFLRGGRLAYPDSTFVRRELLLDGLASLASSRRLRIFVRDMQDGCKESALLK